ncbi:hypothetical protein Pla86_21640 [Planctomycetes bacterium Pla86]|uniref:Uncharacterized protein n=2 Tax=Engelhardtia mirabilis TaxID=2528011 RepID=A0A518BJD6_9BACT|nr:hypothetical protein Pla133_21640 [Planctomycetes bacterium Pla133]QDV01413.1 hypothetical protein Pla86_21640 [Planctomycetes bacterium Pla86]
MANLFDAGLVFAVGILVAFALRLVQGELADAKDRTQAEQSAALEQLLREGLELDRFREGDRTVGGEGQRMGTAYRLSSGEVVYVPDGEQP